LTRLLALCAVLVPALALAACADAPTPPKPATVIATADPTPTSVIVTAKCAADPGAAPLAALLDPRLVSGVPFPGAEAALKANPADKAAYAQVEANMLFRVRVLLEDGDNLAADDLVVRALLKGCTG